MSRTDATRNLAAEARFVETGHRVHLLPGGALRVVSDTHGDLGKGYEVTYEPALDGRLRFACRPVGPREYHDDHLHAESARPGLVPCMHAAGAARTLARHHLAELHTDGLWHVHPDVAAAMRAKAAANQPDNPFDGLPQ